MRDAILSAGDLIAGPCARAVLEAQPARPESVAFLRGNGEREALAADSAAPAFPALAAFLQGSPFDPLDPDWVTAPFEHSAGRGGAPGPPRRPSR